MFGDERSAAQRRCEEAYAKGREKAFEDPLAVTLLQEMTDLIPKLASDKEYECWKAGYEEGLEERMRVRWGSDSPPKPSPRRLDAEKPAATDTERLAPEFWQNTLSDSTPVPRRNGVMEGAIWSFFLIICYCIGMVVVLTVGTREHDLQIRLWLMLIGPIFWTGLVYPFTQRRSNKFIKLWTIFAAVFVISMYYSRFR